MKPEKLSTSLALGALLSLTFANSVTTSFASDTDSKISAIVAGGHETDPRDRGRPVILVASALGVPAEVFREAFTHVRPAPPGRGPSEEEARQNKDALLSALGKYGVTNDRLDEVSNYYRYERRRGELWPVKNAEAYAIVKNGDVTGFVVTNKGSGYSSEPEVTVPGFPSIRAKAHLSFSKDLKDNGCVDQITVVPSRTVSKN